MSCCKFCNGRSVWCRKNKTKIKHGNIRIQSMLLLCLYVKKSLMMPNFFCYEKCILQNPPFPHSHEKFSLVNKEPPECIKSRFRIISYLKALSYYFGVLIWCYPQSSFLISQDCWPKWTDRLSMKNVETDIYSAQKFFPTCCFVAPISSLLCSLVYVCNFSA